MFYYFEITLIKHLDNSNGASFQVLSVGTLP